MSFLAGGTLCVLRLLILNLDITKVKLSTSSNCCQEFKLYFIYRAQQKKPAASVKIAEQISEEPNNVFIDKVSQIILNVTYMFGGQETCSFTVVELRGP